MTNKDEHACADTIISDAKRMANDDLHIASRILSKAYNTLRTEIKANQN